jgi:hypothetical protein
VTRREGDTAEALVRFRDCGPRADHGAGPQARVNLVDEVGMLSVAAADEIRARTACVLERRPPRGPRRVRRRSAPRLPRPLEPRGQDVSR